MYLSSNHRMRRAGGLQFSQRRYISTQSISELLRHETCADLVGSPFALSAEHASDGDKTVMRSMMQKARSANDRRLLKTRINEGPRGLILFSHTILGTSIIRLG